MVSGRYDLWKEQTITDGETGSMAAFIKSNTAAVGRGNLVPEGDYVLTDNVTFEYPARFSGTSRSPMLNI